MARIFQERLFQLGDLLFIQLMNFIECHLKTFQEFSSFLTDKDLQTLVFNVPNVVQHQVEKAGVLQ
jgi:hypothetical protein